MTTREVDVWYLNKQPPEDWQKPLDDIIAAAPKGLKPAATALGHCCCYVFTVGEGGPCRIGISTVPRGQLATIQRNAIETVWPHAVIWMAGAEVAGRVLAWTQYALNDCHIKSNWYRIAPDDALGMLKSAAKAQALSWFDEDEHWRLVKAERDRGLGW